MRGEYWVLEGHELRRATLHEWAEFLDDHEARTVGFDQAGPVRVSTVFLGVDHSYGADVGQPDPLYFESMTFGGEYDCWLWRRYTTWDQAAEGHRALVEAFVAGMVPVPYSSS